jgi:hypothetical protein
MGPTSGRPGDEAARSNPEASATQASFPRRPSTTFAYAHYAQDDKGSAFGQGRTHP